MGLSVWRETSKKLTVYRVCYTPIETLIYIINSVDKPNFRVSLPTDAAPQFLQKLTPFLRVWSFSVKQSQLTGRFI